MKALKTLIVVLTFVALPSLATPLPLIEKQLCENVSLTLWTKSSHPGGNKKGKFNENNRGLGVRCFFQKEDSWFAHVDGLENSRFGNTLSVGFGKQMDLVRIGPVDIFAGASLSLTYYEVKARHQILPGEYVYRTLGEIVVPHPGVHYGVGVDLHELLAMFGVPSSAKLGTLSFQENRLIGNVKLRSFGWQYKFNLL